MTILEVRIELKKGVADPEGENTRKALQLLGFHVNGVRTVKTFEIEIDEDSEEKALKTGKEMCKKLLANPVIHKYSVDIKRD